MRVGETLGPYVVLARLGEGGMGEVYRARDTRLNRTVALKILPEGLASDPQLRARFEREGQTLSQIEHPHICALYDIGTTGDHTFMVMQYLEGETLAARLARGRLPVDQALAIAVEIASALETAHRHGIVHRDVKPANIMLTRTGARLLDFGIAKRARILDSRADSVATVGGASTLTGEGALVGSLHYMAPEQLKGHEADARSDIFALCAVLYEMLSGRRPFDAADSATLIASILDRAPEPLASLTDVPPRVARAVEIGVDKDPDERWQSARDFLRELKWIALEHGSSLPVAAPPPAPTTRRAWLVRAAATLGVVLLAGAAGWWTVTNRAALPGTPRVVLMDSAHPARIYDPATARSGGTNADDLTELLQDLPVVLMKETTGSTWRREEQILAEAPALVVVHRSCFYDSTLLDEPALNQKYFERLYQPAADKLEALLGYLALGDPHTRFIVYSRGSWESESVREAWVAGMERRFPRLKGRLHAYKVPLDRATFRNPQTGREIRTLVVDTLASIGAAVR